jgi:hypothetical protein
MGIRSEYAALREYSDQVHSLTCLHLMVIVQLVLISITPHMELKVCLTLNFLL